MSLQGSLETFALTDVLGLLATTGKTGELKVSGRRREGRMWFDGGQVVGGRIGAVSDPVDVLVELLRLDTGEFTFDHGSRPDGQGEPRAVPEVIAAAEQRVLEWAEIEQVVPSVDLGASLVADAPGDDVHLSHDAWRLVVAVARHGQIRKVMFDLGLSEIEVCRQVKQAVEAGIMAVGNSVAANVAPELDEQAEGALVKRQLAEIGAFVPEPEAEAAPAPRPEPQREARPEPVPERVPEPVAERAPEPVPAAAAAAEGDDAVNRGALLKFLSSVRS